MFAPILLGKMVDCIKIQQNDSLLPSHIDNAAPSLTNPTVPLVSTTGTKSSIVWYFCIRWKLDKKKKIEKDDTEIKTNETFKVLNESETKKKKNS